VDKFCWNPSKKELFDVISFFNVFIPHDSTPFPWRCIWWSKAPLKVVFFTWSVTLGKFITLDNLRKRHIIVVDLCCLCNKSRETVIYLLLHCETTSAL
jgi:hypothetical protein